MERTAYLHQTLLEINSHLRIFPGKFINFFSIFTFFISFVQLLDGRENGHQISYDLKLTYYPITLPNPQSTSNTSLARYSKRKLSWLSEFFMSFCHKYSNKFCATSRRYNSVRLFLHSLLLATCVFACLYMNRGH